jgi:hypothetical protein
MSDVLSGATIPVDHPFSGYFRINKKPLVKARVSETIIPNKAWRIVNQADLTAPNE